MCTQEIIDCGSSGNILKLLQSSVNGDAYEAGSTRLFDEVTDKFSKGNYNNYRSASFR